MEEKKHVSGTLPRLDDASLQNFFATNRDIIHQAGNTRYLICVRRDRTPPWFISESWAERLGLQTSHYISVWRTTDRHLDEVIDQAMDTIMRGGECYVARTSDLLDGGVALMPFWHAFNEFMMNKATDNPTVPVKTLARIITHVMTNSRWPQR